MIAKKEKGQGDDEIEHLNVRVLNREEKVSLMDSFYRDDNYPTCSNI
jgi:hypothetical protein